jgi:hypothetical protein
VSSFRSGNANDCVVVGQGDEAAGAYRSRTAWGGLVRQNRDRCITARIWRDKSEFQVRISAEGASGRGDNTRRLPAFGGDAFRPTYFVPTCV